MTKKLISLLNSLDETTSVKNIDVEVLSTICKILNRFFESNVILVDDKGKILASEHLENEVIFLSVRLTGKDKYIENQLNDQFKNIVETKANTSLSSFYIKNITKTDLKKLVASIVPIGASGERTGTLLCYKSESDFNEEDTIVLEFCKIVFSLILNHLSSELNAETSRKINIVKSAIGTLSYSELEAIIYIFEELENNEGILVASKIADRVGITRSVIVNALRKFESAGVIESRSLGMKGTYIKVLNDMLVDEIAKLRD